MRNGKLKKESHPSFEREDPNMIILNNSKFRMIRAVDQQQREPYQPRLSHTS